MDDLLLPTEVTILTLEQITHTLKEGWKLNFNDYPTVDQLAILWAQVCLETERGKMIRNYNFGNIKKTANHTYCMFPCGENLNGKYMKFEPPHPQTHFNAYPSAVEGAREYISFLVNRKRYKAAWEQVLAGDPVAYCAALKAGGYFTADLDSYTKGVVKLTKEFKSKADTLMTWAPKEDVEFKEEKTEESVKEEPKPSGQIVVGNGKFDVWSILRLLFEFVKKVYSIIGKRN